MKIAIGSTNEIKVKAVEEAIRNYPDLQLAEVFSFSVPSGVSKQPLTLEETIQGARNRAAHAFTKCEGCKYSLGIESGISPAFGAQTGFVHICVCMIYNGSDYHMGLSTGFEIPPSILDLMVEDKMDLSEACFHSGITANPSVGHAEGLIGILTKGRLCRKEYTKQAIISAFVQIENYSWYAK